MNSLSLFLSKIKPALPYRQEITSLDRYITSLKESNIIQSFKLYQDTPADTLNSQAVRFVTETVFAHRKDPVLCTGFGFSEEIAVLKAYSETVERCLFLQNCTLENPYSFQEKKRISSSLNIDTTNGVAFHNNLYDCFLGSLYESIERHVVLGHWYTKEPALFRIDFSDIDYLKSTATLLQEKGASFDAFLLDRTGPVNIVLLMATSHEADSGFHVISSFAAHHNVRAALRKAYYELLSSYLSRPATKIMKDYSNPDSLEDINDHQFYFQSPDKIRHFDFLQAPRDTSIHPDAYSTGTIGSIRRILRFARKHNVNAWTIPMPDTLSDFQFIKTSSPDFLELRFGQEHHHIDVSLLKNFSDTIDLSIPHPIA